MKNSKKEEKWNAPIICFIIFSISILIIALQYAYVSLSKKVYGINLHEFASTRNTYSSFLSAERGTIYDTDGNILAQNITTYTLIAYLDPSRTQDNSNPNHVVDKEYTATKLSKILGEENYDYILKRLNSNSKQVEFGSIGRNLTELTKIAILELNLPGIDFNQTVKRYYPNGNFVPYIIGYAKQYSRINIKIGKSYDLYSYYKGYFDKYENIKVTVSDSSRISIYDKKITALKKGISFIYIKTNNNVLESIIVNVTDSDIYNIIDNTIIGEMGIESKYDKRLQGTDGYIKYQQDKYGYKIPDTKEEKLDPVDGDDIYLTIDSNIQRFAESAISDYTNEYSPEFAIMAVMDAKTGGILASATTPSFNPNNLKSDMSYQNPLISYAYEPGSVMKIFTYLCAVNTGKYDSNKTFLSGEYVFEDGTKMHDFNIKGWGYLTYDSGFTHSSNVGIINIIKDYLSLSELKSCFENFGFGKKTGIELSNESVGSIKFKYETELMAAGYGQGILVTPIQILQGLTIVANDGYMISPHIVDKIVDKNTNEVTETKVNKSKTRKVSSTTASKLKDLMEAVVAPDSVTGRQFYMEGYGLMGKTGTAQIYENGKYLDGANDYIVSVALMYPKNNPEIIIYAAAKKPNHKAQTSLTKSVKELVKNIAKYKNLYNEEETNNKEEEFKVDSYINKNIDEIKSTLESKGLNVIKLGNGNKIIKQYPNKGATTLKGDKIYLLTNSKEINMVNINNWSRADVSKLCNIINLKCNFESSGYVVSQSIKEGDLIKSSDILNIQLGNLKEN